jgi:hypothetical protein
MLKLKLTPFWLFIILLAVLIISIVIGLNTLKQRNEGFVNFQHSAPEFFPVNISGYKNPLIKLYDNNFFDKTNGNLVRVYGSAYSKQSPKDKTGKSLTEIKIYARDQRKNKTYTKDASGNFPNMNENESDTLTSGYGQVFIQNNASDNHIFYSKWGKKSFIHVIDNDKNIATFLIDETQNLIKKYEKSNNSISIDPLDLKKFEAQNASQNDINNGKYISDSNNTIFFQFLPNILFNTLSGRLYVKNAKNGNYDSYDRKNGKITADNNKNESVQFNAYTIELFNMGLLVVMSHGQETVIMLIVHPTGPVAPVLPVAPMLPKSGVE